VEQLHAQVEEQHAQLEAWQATSSGMNQERRHRRRRSGRQDCTQGQGGQGQATANQPAAQQVPAACQAAGQRAFGNAQRLGRGRPTLGLQVAEDQGPPVFLGQPVQLLVQHRQPVAGLLGEPENGFGQPQAPPGDSKALEVIAEEPQPQGPTAS
jgi:hypothetical protein